MARRRRRAFVAAYLALLGASYLYRAVRPADTATTPAGASNVVSVAAVDGARRDPSREVGLAYREWGSAGPPAASPPLVLLHGSPGSSRDFVDLGPRLGARRRVIAPDLPGFGASTSRVPDYSIRAHAEYVRQVLDALEVERFDVVGFSMGGGVALHLADVEPERVRSLTLLSAIGVQELELLGSYELNHALHALQLAGLWALHHAVPHFGVLDDAMLSVPYARNFYDTDQRPLRRILERLEIPTLVLHGRSDPLVPLAAALEHHRVVPQSRLVLFRGDHFMVFSRSEELAAPLEVFLGAVDEGAAARRDEATASRLAAAERPFDAAAKEPLAGVSLVVVLLLLAAATLVSEDLACIAAGVLVAQGAIAFLPAVVGCLIGIVAGDIGLYWAGRLVGRRALDLPPISWVLSEARLAESAAWFERRGPLVILLTRFIPGTRLPTYFSAGLLKTGFLRFSLFFLVAATVWTPLLVGLASLVGRRVFGYFEAFRVNALLGLAVTAAIVWIVVKSIPVLATWRGRRLAVGFWRRWTQWEVWPWWLVYLPIFPWIVWLGIRFRGPTLFTLANPGIPCGGFVGESKGDILAQLPVDVLPAWARLPALPESGARRDALDAARTRLGLDPPFVLKPDVGERGLDVAVVRTLAEADGYVREHAGPTLLQDYVEGSEFGVFYVRHPEAARGRVTSIVAKLLPRVVGDGASSLERLILRDDRAVCQAARFLADHDGSLERVPAAGEEVRLGELGTHWRGAVFLDANHLGSPDLDAAVDRIARGVEGFHFGRFDVRVPSEEHLRRGEGLRILELNGVTSEEAHMYDPKHGVGYAWRTLAAQWRTAFEIGAANRARGHRPATVRELWRQLRRHLERDGAAG